MANYKINTWKKSEKFILFLILNVIVVHAVVRQDSIVALVSALCGITYTFLAGKGLPICYLFGVTGSGFYSYLAFQNTLWANLFLYACYYIPMQIIGYYRWNKNLQNNKKEIVKIVLPKKEMFYLVTILSLLSFVVYYCLIYLKDANPILDSITAVFSIGGMYLTVRRAIEQWIFWMVVNTLSLIMWITVAISGARVYSTIAMWTIYLFLAVYFYIVWKKEIKNND